LFRFPVRKERKERDKKFSSIHEGERFFSVIEMPFSVERKPLFQILKGK